MSETAVAAEVGTNVPVSRPWVVFSCEDRRFGVPLDSVSEITTPRPFTRLPGAGREVCGLAGVRGRVVTVFDLGVVLGLRAAASVPDHRLLLLDVGARHIGAVVENVAEIAPARLEQGSGVDGAIGTGYMNDIEFTALDPRMLLGRFLPG